MAKKTAVQENTKNNKQKDIQNRLFSHFILAKRPLKKLRTTIGISWSAELHIIVLYLPQSNPAILILDLDMVLTMSEQEKESGSLVVSQPRTIYYYHTENCWR